MNDKLTVSHEFRYTMVGDCGHEAPNLLTVGYKQVKMCGPCCGQLWEMMQLLPYLRVEDR